MTYKRLFPDKVKKVNFEVRFYNLFKKDFQENPTKLPQFVKDTMYDLDHRISKAIELLESVGFDVKPKTEH